MLGIRIRMFFLCIPDPHPIDRDPYPNVTDPQHWGWISKLLIKGRAEWVGGVGLRGRKVTNPPSPPPPIHRGLSTKPVFRILDIFLVQIRIHRSVPLTNWSGCGSGRHKNFRIIRILIRIQNTGKICIKRCGSGSVRTTWFRSSWIRIHLSRF